ncbi:hypothetical protein S-CBS3_gp30 [Synechococcus phage S-CBS3]|uniref:hypothetical protein n=1 Tax=Synechococcus phage S-CBS3 TaxID=753085 RepID=UPI0002078462|nr:hypothetical protein S-CBS3_gp30 [Synechococcus phage S-CBS3]ADF42488.1 hypothetical protein S-CBS3_gp30 [Synechococcus phage S-CBS3]
MHERRYYFQIQSANVIDCVMAISITDAKAQAFEAYGHMWPELKWINIDTITESVIYD